MSFARNNFVYICKHPLTMTWWKRLYFVHISWTGTNLFPNGSIDKDYCMDKTNLWGSGYIGWSKQYEYSYLPFKLIQTSKDHDPGCSKKCQDNNLTVLSWCTDKSCSVNLQSIIKQNLKSGNSGSHDQRSLTWSCPWTINSWNEFLGKWYITVNQVQFYLWMLSIIQVSSNNKFMI